MKFTRKYYLRIYEVGCPNYRQVLVIGLCRDSFPQQDATGSNLVRLLARYITIKNRVRDDQRILTRLEFEASRKVQP
jgi:hypothetical protein